MKKIVFFLLFVNLITFAQAPPQGISHRGTVYNTINVLMPNTPVKIRISILDNSATGTEVYKEIHSLTTNNQGQYSLNIGQGSNPTVAFNTINWSLNLKYLKVEIDLTNTATISSPNPSFAVQGSNQLMSVPYALYALNSQVKVFNNIVELRNSKGNINDIVYIKGHTTVGDGGEGNFIWKANLPTLLASEFFDNDGTIIRKSNDVPGEGWIRLIEDRINVKFFGVNFNDNLDDGVKIQKAIDFAYQNALNRDVFGGVKYRDYTNSGSVVYIPAGEYRIMGKLTLKNGVSIEGDGIMSTILKADNSINKVGSMIEIDGGPVSNVHVSNMFFDGGVIANGSISTEANVTKNCLFIYARSNTVYNTGGLWSSSFKNIVIRNFNGSGIVMEGSGVNSQDRNYTNQDIRFEGVSIVRQKENASCLLVRGMHGQLTYINCGFDGLIYNDNGSTFNINKNWNVAIETNAVEAAVIKFLTCTFQNSEYGLLTTYAQNITLDNCWFELLDVGVAAGKAATNSNASKCINILNSRFANAAGFGTEASRVNNRTISGGTCISVEGGSNVNVQNNYVLTSIPDYNSRTNNSFFIRNWAVDSKINASNNSFQNPSLGRTLGIANRTINITGNFLDTFGYKFVSVTTSTLNIQEIKSEISAGETITIKASGTTGQIKFDNTKNIVFSKPTTTSLILLPNENATFMKVDSEIGPINGIFYNEIYQLISVNKTY